MSRTFPPILSGSYLEAGHFTLLNLPQDNGLYLVAGALNPLHFCDGLTMGYR